MKKFIKDYAPILVLSAWALLVMILFPLIGTNVEGTKAITNSSFYLIQIILVIAPIGAGLWFKFEGQYLDNAKMYIWVFYIAAFILSCLNMASHTPSIFK